MHGFLRASEHTGHLKFLPCIIFNLLTNSAGEEGRGEGGGGAGAGAGAGTGVRSSVLD